jgi:hypothetical protein
MIELNEGTTCVVSIDFKDENGVDVVPTSGRYRVDDAESGTVVLHWTAFTPTSANQLLYIQSNSNRLIAQEHDRETRVVTVEFTYGATIMGTEETRYTIKGLKYY